MSTSDAVPSFWPSPCHPAMQVAALSLSLQSLWIEQGWPWQPFVLIIFHGKQTSPFLWGFFCFILICFSLLFLFSGHRSPKTSSSFSSFLFSSSSSFLFSSSSFRGSSEGRRPSHSWRLATQSQTSPKATRLPVLLRLTQETAISRGPE